MVVAAVLVSIAGLWTVRRLVHYSRLKPHNDVAGFIFATLGVIYAVLLAFAVLQVWEEASEAESRVAVEDGVVRSIYTSLRAWPDSAASAPVLAQLRRYVTSVVRDEYPAMAAQREEGRTDEEFQKLWAMVVRMPAPDAGTQSSVEQIQSLLGDLGTHRAMRLESAGGEIPTPLWYALILGAVITVAYTWIFGAESFPIQVTINSALAILIATTLYVIILLNHPFIGSVSVHSRGQEQLLKVMSNPSVSP
jgi:hypothetical protein